MAKEETADIEGVPQVQTPSILKPIAPTQKSKKAIKYAGWNEQNRVNDAVNHSATLLSRNVLPEKDKPKQTLG